MRYPVFPCLYAIGSVSPVTLSSLAKRADVGRYVQFYPGDKMTFKSYIDRARVNVIDGIDPLSTANTNIQ